MKQERYIQQEFAEYTHLSELGLLPGTSFFITGVKVTKQKGFAWFNVAGYWRRKSKGKVEDEGWYLLTNLYLFHKLVLQLVGIVFVSQFPNIRKKNVRSGFGLKFGKLQKS